MAENKGKGQGSTDRWSTDDGGDRTVVHEARGGDRDKFMGQTQSNPESAARGTSCIRGASDIKDKSLEAGPAER